MLVLFVAFYFVVIMAGIILPWWVLIDWWFGEETVDMTTVVIVACVAWVLGFFGWLNNTE